VGLHLLVTRQEGVLYLKDSGVLVQEIASVRVSKNGYAYVPAAVFHAPIMTTIVDILVKLSR